MPDERAGCKIASHDERRADQQLTIGSAADVLRERAIARQRRQHPHQAGDRAEIRPGVALCRQDHELERLIDQQWWDQPDDRGQLIVLENEMPAVANLEVEQPRAARTAVMKDDGVRQLEDPIPG